MKPFSNLDEVGEGVGELTVQHMCSTFAELANHPSKVVHERYNRYVTGEPHPLGNVATCYEPSNLGDVCEAVEPLAKGHYPSAVAFPSASIAGDVHAQLLDWGFFVAEEIPGMAADLCELPSTTLANGYALERATSMEQLANWAVGLAVGYGLPLAVAKIFCPSGPSSDSQDAPLQYFSALDEKGKVCSVALVWMSDGVAGIYCVATLPEHRGKGLGAHITAEALRAAMQCGYGVGVLQSSEMGLPVYQRLGFKQYSSATMYARIPE